MTLFGRSARFVVGPLEVKSEGELGLRITFQVKRSTNLESNSATVQIWNLSENTRNALDDAAARASQAGIIDRITLEAGFTDDTRALFCGDRAWVSHVREGVNWVTQVEMLDGAKALSQQLSISAAPGTSAKEIVQSIKDQVGVAWNQIKAGGDVIEALNNVLFDGGKVLDGSAKKALKQMADAAKLSVSVQDCELQFLKPDGEVVESGVRLSATTGLIGTPERYRDPENPKASLLRGNALLMGDLRPGKRFVVDAKNEFGIFKLLQVTHTGDTHGGNGSWMSAWEGQEIR